MDPLWIEFRSSPSAYLSSRKMDVDVFVNDVLQVVSSEEKNDLPKLAILGIFQEMGPILFTDPERLEATISTLKNTFLQQRTSGSSMCCSQILCTITALLVELEDMLRDQVLVETVNLLFDVVEKVKTDSNRLLKFIACECLKELEMAYPLNMCLFSAEGLLSMKVGHFFGMSQAENASIHQNYMSLFVVVLEHTIQKYLVEIASSSHPPEDTLSDLLSYTYPLKSFRLGKNFREQAALLLKEPPVGSVGDDTDLYEVKKGVSFVLENLQLMTNCCFVHTAQGLISCVQSSGLAPTMLKSLLLQYSSSHDLQLFHLVLLLTLKFGEDICDEGDEKCLQKWLVIMACHPSLPSFQRSLVWEWLLQWPQALHDCCTLTSTADFCLLGKAPSQLYYSFSYGIQ